MGTAMGQKPIAFSRLDPRLTERYGPQVGFNSARGEAAAIAGR